MERDNIDEKTPGGEQNFPSPEEMLARYEKPLINYLRGYLGNLEDAEDVAQHAFIKTYLNRRKCPSPEALGGYLYKTAANCALNILRRRRILNIVSFGAMGGPKEDGGSFAPENIPDDGGNDPGASYADRQKRQRVRRAVSELPAEQKSALLLYFYDDKSYAQIAGILGKSVSAVESLLFRARRTLEEKLKDL